MLATMEDTPELIGQVVCLPGGVKVRVESIEGNPPSATLRRVGGPFDGQVAICDVSKLEPLGSEGANEAGIEKSNPT
jgi:hypothetical protein